MPDINDGELKPHSVRESLLLLHEKMDSLIKSLPCEDRLKRMDNHGSRIRKLENWRNLIVGGFAVITILFGLAWDIARPRIDKRLDMPAATASRRLP